MHQCYVSTVVWLAPSQIETVTDASVARSYVMRTMGTLDVQHLVSLSDTPCITYPCSVVLFF